jgi:hypothetical protein
MLSCTHSEKHRTGRIQLDEQGDQRQQWCDDKQSGDRSHHADQARGQFRGAMVAEPLGEDQGARPQRLDRHLSRNALVQLDRVVNVDAADA